MELERDYLRKARRKNRETRGYFDDDDDDESFSRNGSDSTSLRESNDMPATANGPAQDEIDPLDAFMAGISAQVKQEQSTAKQPAAKPTRIFADDDDAYMEGHARSKPRGSLSGGINTTEFVDSDEEVYATAKRVDGEEEDDEDDPKKKAIEVLAPLNHCAIEYETFRKQFYTPHAAIAALTDAEAKDLVHELGVTSDGRAVPRPIQSFVQVGFDRKMLAMLMKLGLEAPTPIQAQAFPIALSGRDLIGIAKTGSGKTLAFTLPMVVHVMDQRKLRHGEGPIAIVLSPTRELAHQIFGQAKKFLHVYGAQCAAVYGGVGKWDQIQVLRKGAEVVVATPGRLIDMIRKKNVPTKRVTFVVLDEADRMFEMGFEPQLRSIMGQIRPDRQTLMFSATFRKRVEHLARDVLQDPIKITVGQIGQANEDIHQIAVVLANHKAKWPWLMANLKRIVADGRVLIFVASKTGCEEMAKNLHALGYPCNCLHGDKTQQERNEALASFRTGASPILVATDVASRGLDVKEVKTVINYDVAKNIDTHVHRIGRTGRMGAEGFEPGTAYTLVTNHDSQFAAQLVYNMDVSGQAVAADLLALAKRDPRFRRGAPANGGGFSASASPSDGGSSHLTLHGKDRALDGDDEGDVLEMKRWNESQKTTKAERRKGLGFAADVGGSSGGIRMAFVKASSATASSCPPPFQTGFAQASHTPAPPHGPMMQPPRPPPVPVQAPPPPPLGLISPPAFRPPTPPPAFAQAAPLPPHVGQLESRMKSTDGDGTVPVGLQAPSSSPHIAQSSDTQPSVINDASLAPQEQRGRNDSRERDRSSRSRHRSGSSSRSRSRGRRYDRRSRSHSRGRRRYRSRSQSRSPSRSRSRRRSRSSDRYARNTRWSRSRSRGRRRH